MVRERHGWICMGKDGYGIGYVNVISYLYTPTWLFHPENVNVLDKYE
jgi:hypothetical protein